MIDATTRARASAVSNLLPAHGYSPEALLLYCRTRMSDFDGQIDQAMARQHANAGKSKALSDLSAVLHLYPALPNGGPEHAAAYTAIRAAFDDAIARCGGPGTAEGAKLRETFEAFHRTAHPEDTSTDAPWAVNENEMSGFTQSVSDLQKSLNAGAEIEMMQLQSVVSQRSTFLQFVSSQLQSLDQTAKAILSR